MIALLNYLRSLRGFDVNLCLNKKIEIINNFFRKNNLDSVVIGLSGGIDSSVVYSLLIAAAYTKDSPIKIVRGLSLPILKSNGVTGQKEACEKAYQLYHEQLKHYSPYYRIQFEIEDLSIAMKSLSDRSSNDWANGQLASILRTPVLYYHAAILQSYGHKSIVGGTTNRDEGSYIGFYGKASDGMVDLQPIADLHKSEIYKLANLLNIPENIITSIPKGDVFDDRTDEQMIGAPYWFIELFALIKDYIKTHVNEILYLMTKFSIDEHKSFRTYTDNIQKLHDINKHKYEVGSPAHYLDIYPRKVT